MWSGRHDERLSGPEARVGCSPPNTWSPLLTCRLGLVKPAVIDSESAAAVLGINFDESMAESDVAPNVVLLCLNRSSDNRVDSDNGHKKQRATGLERFSCCAEERTLLVDSMPQRYRRRKAR